MTAQHTPGPWVIDRDPRRGMSWNNHILDKARGHAVCFMAHSGGKEPESDESNARLIAAAPELLEALEFYMSAFGQHLEFVGQKFDAQQVEADKKARTAIAKATGENQ